MKVVLHMKELTPKGRNRTRTIKNVWMIHYNSDLRELLIDGIDVIESAGIALVEATGIRHPQEVRIIHRHPATGNQTGEVCNAERAEITINHRTKPRATLELSGPNTYWRLFNAASRITIVEGAS